MPDTTPIPSTDGTPEAADDAAENWSERYVGLQKVVAKRDSDLTATRAELDSLRAEKEAADLELAAFRQTTVDASEAEAAEAQYEQLRERFEPRPPMPISNAAARPNAWTDRDTPGRYSPGYDEEGNPAPDHSWLPT